MASVCGTGQSENRRFRALRNLGYTTRANISREIAEQIRARIVCTPAYIGVAGVGEVCALTKARIFASLLQWGIDRFAQANAVGVAETGAEGGAVYHDG